jgi:hypothetical protein
MIVATHEFYATLSAPLMSSGHSQTPLSIGSEQKIWLVPFFVWARNKALETIWGYGDDFTKVLREKKILADEKINIPPPWADINGLKTFQKQFKS